MQQFSNAVFLNFHLPLIEKVSSMFKKTPGSEFFALFLIESKLLKVAVWEKKDKEINVLNVVKENFSGSLEELIEIADRAISRASVDVPPQKLKQVIFSLPSNWVEQGKIQTNYLKFLKNLCASLSLSPIGFVTTQEAMVKNLEKEEKNKLNLLLLYVSPEILNLHLIARSEIKECVFSLRGENSIAQDFFELVARFNEQTLPSKILIFDGTDDLEKITQEIIKSPLISKEKRFLQFPKVVAMPENFDVKSVICVVNEQMSVNFGGQMRKEVMAVAPSPKEVEGGEEKAHKKKAGAEKLEISADLSQIGFFFDKDVGHVEEIAVRRELPQEPTIAEEPAVLPTEQKVSEEGYAYDFSVRRSVFIIVGVIFLVILAVFAFWFFVVKADLKLYVKTNDFKDEVSFASSQLKIKDVLIEQSGEKTVSATGKKKTGDKAKGEVVIFNKNTDAEKTFKKGAIITDGTLKFLLDTDVKVATASEKTDGKVYGKAAVKVTAEKFGTEYNVSENKDWTIDNYAQSSYSAHNDLPFTGGTTKEIRVVSEADLKKVLSLLRAELLTKATAKLKTKIDTQKEEALGEFLKEEIIDKKYSAEVNSPAKEVTLNLKINFQTFSFQKEDAKNIFEQTLAQKIPKGFYIDENSINLKLKNAVEKGDGYELTFSYSVRAIPKIVTSEVSDKLVGKPLASVDSLIREDKNVLKYDLNVWPRFPSFLDTMPHQKGNIKIAISY